MKHLQKLCGTSGVFPASFMLTDKFDDIETQPFTSGGFAHVYRATYKDQPVVAKALKTDSVEGLDDVHKVWSTSRTIVRLLTLHLQRFVKEVVGWKWLRHENIVPFVGVASGPTSLSMVSVWMENGNILNFMKATPDQNPFPLVGIPHFESGIAHPIGSSLMWPMDYNTYTSMT